MKTKQNELSGRPLAGGYSDFIAQKSVVAQSVGFEPLNLSSAMFPFQIDIASWACRKGRAALFEDCGLGKTIQELCWAQQIVERFNESVIIFAPLGVTHQFVREGAKFGIQVNLATCQADVTHPGIWVTNYEKMHKFDLSKFKGMVVDESSILKSLDGATRNELIERGVVVPFRLAGTATPSPNDFMELGNHAEFLGVMTRAEMLSTFFVHDGGDTSKWRLKGHAEKEFWKWICSWAVNIRKPSDLGYEDGAFKLPPLEMHEHIVSSSQKLNGYLFALPASTLIERRDARKASLNERVDRAAELATSNDGQWVFWCNLNIESEALAKSIGAVEVRGSTSEEERERIILGFLDGSIRHVVSKPSLWGFGLNLQCCHQTAFVGVNDSFEQFYQALRRFWRFGQTQPVDAHVIISDLEGAVLANIKRKEADAMRMANAMIEHMADISSNEIKSTTRHQTAYNPQEAMQLPDFIYA